MAEELNVVATEELQELSEIDNTVLEETARGYEEFIRLVASEIERVGAYEKSTPYGDVLLTEREAIVNAYRAITETIKDRGGEFKNAVTGVVNGIGPKEPETSEVSQ